MTHGEIGFFGWLQISALALFLGVFLTQTWRVRAREHINPITLSLGKRGWLGLVELALFLGVNVWTMLVLLYSLPGGISRLPRFFQTRLIGTLVTRWFGMGLIGAGFVICLMAVTALGDSWRLGIDENRPGRLVTAGIYAFSRNPIYLFFDLYFVGTFLINGALVFMLFAAFTIANLHYQILQEEEFLSRIHGPAYQAYRERTPRYFAASAQLTTEGSKKHVRT